MKQEFRVYNQLITNLSDTYKEVEDNNISFDAYVIGFIQNRGKKE